MYSCAKSPPDAKLRVETSAKVTRILIDDNQAVGIENWHRGVIQPANAAR
jgi:hypothetical protein